MRSSPTSTRPRSWPRPSAHDAGSTTQGPRSGAATATRAFRQLTRQPPALESLDQQVNLVAASLTFALQGAAQAGANVGIETRLWLTGDQVFAIGGEQAVAIVEREPGFALQPILLQPLHAFGLATVRDERSVRREIAEVRGHSDDSLAQAGGQHDQQLLVRPGLPPGGRQDQADIRKVVHRLRQTWRVLEQALCIDAWIRMQHAVKVEEHDQPEAPARFAAVIGSRDLRPRFADAICGRNAAYSSIFGSVRGELRRPSARIEPQIRINSRIH